MSRKSKLCLALPNGASWLFCQLGTEVLPDNAFQQHLGVHSFASYGNPRGPCYARCIAFNHSELCLKVLRYHATVCRCNLPCVIRALVVSKCRAETYTPACTSAHSLPLSFALVNCNSTYLVCSWSGSGKHKSGPVVHVAWSLVGNGFSMRPSPKCQKYHH